VTVSIEKDSLHTIQKSTVGFFSGTMLSRISGMCRDISLAFCFGTHEALAALFVAFRLTYLARRLFGEGILQAAFVPLFEEIRQQDSQRGLYFFRDLAVLWTLLLLIFSLTTISCINLPLQFFSLSHSTREIIFLISIMMPSLIPVCLFGLNTSFLQCQRRYFLAGVSPLFFNLIIILAAFSLRHYTPTHVMPYLAISIVLACVTQWTASFLPIFYRYRSSFHFSRNIQLFSPDLQRIWKPFLLGLIGIGASQINNALDAVFARIADPEGPAHLWFSIRFQQLPLSLFGIALSGAILPPLSRAIQTEDTERYHHFLAFGIRQVIALLLPCAAILFLLGMPMINCIYGHGAFQKEAIVLTTGCLHGYALGLIPMGIIVILAPAFYAKKNYLVPMKGACISLSLNLILNSVMIFGLGWKAISISIATSVAAWVNALYLSYMLRKEIGSLLSVPAHISCLKTGIVTLMASIVLYTSMHLFTTSPLLFQYLPTTTIIPTDFKQQLFHLFVPLTTFAGALLAFASLLKADDMTQIVSFALSRK